MNLSRMIKTASTAAMAHLPDILTAITVIGVGVTVYNAIEETANAVEVNNEIPEEAPPMERVKQTFKCYKKTCASGAVTIASALLSNAAAKHQRNAVIGELIATKHAMDTYISSAEKVVGKDKEKEIRMETAKELNNTASELPDTTVMFYEANSKTYFKDTIENVYSATYELNRLFILRGYASLNDLMRLLNLPEQPEFEEIGWCDTAEPYWGYKWIDFYYTTKRGKKGEYVAISCPFQPHLGYLDGDFDNDTPPFDVR